MERALLLCRWVFIFLFWMLIQPESFSQNLVPNPDFETHSWCPGGFGTGGNLASPPWVNGNDATADYLHECADPDDVGIPANFFGNQPAHSGDGYAGLYARESSIWREYIQAPLTQPLTAGITYHVSFYASLSDFGCGVTHLGAYLSSAPPPDNTIGWLPVTPQIDADMGYLSNNEDWTLISGCFTAVGGEQWITIGNFYDNNNSPLDPDCDAGFYSYYYIDDVSVTEGEPGEILELELGEEVTTCDPYEIESGITDVDYHWSDGSNDPTLTVTESGTYVLTVTSGCSQAIDSVEVIFLGAEGVDIGPSEFTLCNGEVYSITLDPDAGDYEWQDGSDDPQYIITDPGTYSVTLDDGCDLTSDEITITVLDVPAPFSLGDDTPLCAGDEIEYSFDDDLGNFMWQDGSNSPDYTISEPGLYTLTISNQCGSFSDNILVTNGVDPVVDLGPDQSICAGDNLVIDLNPNLGDYEWQDGNTSSTYTISDGGIYSVTVTNGCGTDTDQIMVSVHDAPASFSLGEDLNLCEGEEIEFSFDPDLGDFEWQDQTTDANYTVTTSGLYSLTISNECGEVSDAVAVSEIPLPEVDLGDDLILCSGENLEIHLNDAIGDYEWQDGSTSSSYSITEPGIYSVTVSNECGFMSDELIASIINEPVFDLGQNITVCPAQLPITLDVSHATNAVSFLWQDNSTNAQIQVLTGGTYMVTVSNQCFSVEDQIDITIEDASPLVVLPADQSVCEGDTVQLSANGVVGNYLWQDGSTSATFLATNAGTYALTVSNQCGSGSDSVTITTINQVGPLDLGNDVSLCPGDVYTLYANETGVNYLWNDMSTADSLVVNGPGIYFLQIENACHTSYDTVIVSVNDNPPVVNLPDTIPLCEKDTLTINAGIAGVQFLWNTGSQASFISLVDAGMYSVTVSNSCGTDADTMLVMNAGSAPIVSLGADMIICPGDTVQLAPVSSGVTSWLWHDGSIAPLFQVISPGIVSVQVSNQCGFSTDSLQISLLPAVPSFDLGADTTLCPGEIMLLAVNIQDVDILWSDGSTGPDYDVNTPGNIFATITNQCGSATDSISIDFLPALPALDLGPDQSLSPGELITIAPGISAVDYMWHDGSSDSLFSTIIPGLITLTISNECGASSDTMIIHEDTNGPQLDLGDDISGCVGEIVMINAGILGVDYLWQDGSTGPDFFASESGTYILQVNNACGEDKDTVQVLFNLVPPAPFLGEDTTLCEGQELSLNSTADGLTDIEWQDGSHLPVMNVTAPGMYILTESNQCGSVSDSIFIDYDRAPEEFTLGPDTTLCPGEFLMLSAPTAGGQITWQDGSSDEMMIADQPQTYSLQVSNRCGVVSDEINVSINDQVPSLNMDKEFFICPGQSITLDVTQSFQSQYSWSNGDPSPVILLNSPGAYSITVSTECSSVEGTIEVKVDDDCHEVIYIPNVFTPNNDGINDVFEIFTAPDMEIDGMTTRIFDRWGNNVFTSTEANWKWDGRFRNAELPSSVFVFVIELRYLMNGELHEDKYSGDITLIR